MTEVLIRAADGLMETPEQAKQWWTVPVFYRFEFPERDPDIPYAELESKRFNVFEKGAEYGWSEALVKEEICTLMQMALCWRDLHNLVANAVLARARADWLRKTAAPEEEVTAAEQLASRLNLAATFPTWHEEESDCDPTS